MDERDYKALNESLNKPSDKTEGAKILKAVSVDFLTWVWLNKYTDSNHADELYDIYIKELIEKWQKKQLRKQ